MKINFVYLKFSKLFLLISCIILILITSFLIQTKNFQKEEIQNEISLISKENNNSIIQNSINYIKEQPEIKIKSKSRILQKKLKGFEIIGKIEIPKLKVEKYILSQTSTKSLKVSVTKVCGPDINQIGNFCIAGHNYNKIFGKIKTLEKNDKILLTDVYGDTTIYQVYDIYKTSPKDVSCLNQDTQSEKELTLITCTAGATKRVIVKAVEVYD